MCQALSGAIRSCRQHGALGVIAELKRRSAGGADLFRGRSAAEIARAYRSAGACALSVVTSHWFGGSLRLLKETAEADLGLAILRKDLIRTEQDITAAQRAGASAVLLVLPLLGLARLLEMVQAAREHGMEPFVEVASQAEIEQVRAIYPGVIAINNADIKTNEVEGADISRSLALIDRKDSRLWVSASRIRGAGDVTALGAAGFDGVLIGTHLLSADDLELETRRVVAAAAAHDPNDARSVPEVARPWTNPGHPLLKVCGVTTPEEIEHLSRCGVDFFGLQVGVPSPWAIGQKRAAQLAAMAKGRLASTLVTKFVTVQSLENLIRETEVRAVQLGPDARARHVAQLRRAFARDELTILQEIPYDGGRFWNEEEIDEYVAAGVDLILLDKLHKTRGGAPQSASTIPPHELTAFRQRHLGQPILVAGGISPDNVQALVSASGAVGIDVCSSVRRGGTIQPDLLRGLMDRLARGASSVPQVVRPSLRELLAAPQSAPQLIAYLTLGDPADKFLEVAEEVLEAGALTLELGFPHPRPLEGAVLRASHERSIHAGTDTNRAMSLLGSIARAYPARPLVAVVQWPAIDRDDELAGFLDALAGAGAAAVLPVGMPLWQAPRLAAHAHARGLETVLACSPWASQRRLRLALRYCSGCLYVARGTVTGGEPGDADLADFCRTIAAETDVPLVVGVGVKRPQDVAEICATRATAAVVGSALVEHVASGASAGDFVRRLLAR